MNKTAKNLGMKHTTFKNPNGLHNKEQKTTARDMAILASAIYHHYPEYYNLFSTKTFSYKGTSFKNHNHLLKHFKGADGMKTGYTKKSGRSLVSAAERDGLTLIAVTIDAPDDWRDHTELLDLGFSLFEKKALARAGEYRFDLPVINGEKSFVSVSNKDDIFKIFNKNDTDFDVNIKLNRFCPAPISKGDALGELVFTKDGEEISRLMLTADFDVNKNTRKRLFSFLKKD